MGMDITRADLDRLLDRATTLPEWALEGLAPPDADCQDCGAPLDLTGKCPIGCE